MTGVVYYSFHNELPLTYGQMLMLTLPAFVIGTVASAALKSLWGRLR